VLRVALIARLLLTVLDVYYILVYIILYQFEIIINKRHHHHKYNYLKIEKLFTNAKFYKQDDTSHKPQATSHKPNDD
jgi:hypothetical protein